MRVGNVGEPRQVLFERERVEPRRHAELARLEMDSSGHNVRRPGRSGTEIGAIFVAILIIVWLLEKVDLELLLHTADGSDGLTENVNGKTGGGMDR
jgi:hypothetical protein